MSQIRKNLGFMKGFKKEKKNISGEKTTNII